MKARSAARTSSSRRWRLTTSHRGATEDAPSRTTARCYAATATAARARSSAARTRCGEFWRCGVPPRNLQEHGAESSGGAASRRAICKNTVRRGVVFFGLRRQSFYAKIPKQLGHQERTSITPYHENDTQPHTPCSLHCRRRIDGRHGGKAAAMAGGQNARPTAPPDRRDDGRGRRRRLRPRRPCGTLSGMVRAPRA